MSPALTPADRIRQLAKLRLFHLHNLEEAANEIAAIDHEIAILENRH